MMEANKERIKKELKSSHAEIKSTVSAIEEKMDAWIADMKACQEATEAYTEKTMPDPGMMQSIGEHQEVPKEEAAVMLVGGLRKQRRDRNLAGGAYRNRGVGCR
jgi:hypothetical protein